MTDEEIAKTVYMINMDAISFGDYCNVFGGNEAYSGYYETYDISVGDNGMFMNTKYDTLENLKTIFPGRAEKHFEVFALLLEKLIMNPMKKQG